MTYTFKGITEPTYPMKFKERMFRFMVHHLMNYGQRHAVNYFRRGMTLFMQNHFNGRLIVGCEIGTWKGANAEVMLQALPNISKLYCIDEYKDYTEKRGDKLVLKSMAEKHQKSAHKRLKKYDERVSFIRTNSLNAVISIPDNLDFVYIDGNHGYEFVKRDIECYYPKIKERGVLGGHDFSSGFLGVPNAVFEFCNDKGLELFGGRDGDWWVVKPQGKLMGMNRVMSGNRLYFY